jgi:uncharacterized MnhB-related membrane protein
VPALLTIAVLAAGALGTLVAVVRTPGRQAIVQSAYGLMLAIAFVLLQAPDVALSQIAVGTILVPFMALVTVAKIRKAQR